MRGTEEAARRAAVHAAYYGVYHLLTGRLGLDPTVRREADHGRLLTRVMGIAEGDDPVVDAAKTRLGELKVRRSKADYDLAMPLDIASAGTAIALAEAIFAAA